MFTQYNEAVEWINGLIPLGIKPGLERMKWLMERLNNPHHRLKFIHVAGTNGKGSTCSFLSQVILANGYDVGSFTSPYLHKFTERIQYNGQPIGDEDVVELANLIKPLTEELSTTELGSPTMFEVVTTMAILYFSSMTYPHFVVWEVGLGGLYDSTNIVIPIVSVITNIGHDHMDILGESITEIAMQKAGIIKAGVPVVSAVSQAEAKTVIKKTVQQKKTTLYLLEEQFSIETLPARMDEQVFNFRGPFRTIPGVTITLNGAHQMTNAAVAIMTMEVLRQYYALIVEEESFYKAMQSAKWPGRLELVSEQPRILLDGAHNPEGAESLAAALKHTYKYDGLNFIIGMLEGKNHTAYLRHILPLVDKIIITEPDFRKKADASQLAVIVSEMQDISKPNLEIIIEPYWQQAIDKGKEFTYSQDLLVVSGSLYLISDVRSYLLHYSESEKGW